MNKKIIFIFFLLLSIWPMYKLSQPVEHSNIIKREVASDNLLAHCKDSIEKFFSKNSSLINSKKEKLLREFNQHTLDYRIATIELLLKLDIKSNSTRRNLAELLNQSLKDKLISIDDLKNLIGKINQKKPYVHIGKNNVVYIDLIEELVSEEQLKSISYSLTSLNSLDKENFINKIFTMDLNLQEMEALRKIGSQIDNNKSQKVISFISYLHTLKPDDRSKALNEIEDIFKNESQNKLIKNFIKYQTKISHFIEKEKANFISKESLSADEALLKASLQGQIYERLIYGCRARTLSTERLAANKKFIFTMIGAELAIDSNAYLFTHMDQEKDLEWYKKFSFEMLLDIGNILLSSKISMNPGNDHFSKMMRYYVSAAVTTIPTAISYSVLFNNNDADKEKAYNEIMSSPQFKKEIAELISYLDKHEEQIRLNELMIPLLDSGDKNLPKNEETKELLFKALTKELYAKQQGEWIHTGDVGLDRYTYDRIWGTQAAVRNIAVNLLMYDALCMGELNPKKAYTLALSYFVINKGIFDPAYNYLRRRAVNQ